MLIFEWKSLSDLITEIQGRYKLINSEFPLNKTMALEWAMEIVQEVGLGIYEPRVHYAKVCDNIIKLPTDVILIDGVWLATANCPKPQQTYWNDLHLYPIRYVKGANTNLLCNPSVCRNSTSRKTFSINGRVLIFNFSDEWVTINYYGLQLDDNNLPMIPELRSLKKAIESYIVMQWLSEAALLKKDINYNELLKVEERYNQYLKQAKADFLMDQVNLANLKEGFEFRYKRFQIPK